MKNGIIITALAVVLAACGGGGGGGDDTGSAPQIMGVEFYQIVDGERIVGNEFIIDDIFSMQMTAADADMDMARYFVFVVGDGVDNQRSREIPPTETEVVEIYDYRRNVYDYADQFGTHQACFWIVDAAGNESGEYCTAFTVTDF